MKYWIIAALGAVLVGCGSTPKAPESAELEYKKCVFPDAPSAKAPSWLCSQPVDGLELSVWGASAPRAAGVGFTTDVATQNARRRLAEVFATRIASEYQQYINEHTENGIRLSQETIKQKTLSETGMTLVGSRVFYTQVSPNRHMYVLVGLDDEAYKRNMEALFNSSIDPDNPEIFREFLLDQAGERLQGVGPASDGNANNTTEVDAAASTVGYGDYKKAYQQDYSDYKKQFMARYQKFKQRVMGVWGEGTRLSDNKVYVAYSDDLSQRTVIDYENGTLDVETVADKPLDEAQLRVELTQLAQTSVAEQAQQDPVLAAQDVDNEASVLATWASEEEVDKLLAEAEVSASESNVQITPVNYEPGATKRATTKRVKRMRMQLPQASLTKRRATPFIDDAAVLSERLSLPQDLLLAVMEVESSFNPLAQSPIPAFGLMQVVPTSAGLDVNKLIFDKPMPPSIDVLLDARQNMVFGSNYLALLRDRYLDDIDDPQSRLYCMIAAYNTGAGNVARTFHPQGKPSVSGAVEVINSMTPEEVFAHLREHLPYDETRRYMDKVNQAMEKYRM